MFKITAAAAMAAFAIVLAAPSAFASVLAVPPANAERNPEPIKNDNLCWSNLRGSDGEFGYWSACPQVAHQSQFPARGLNA